MIEPVLRNNWILEQAEDDEVAVILFDVVIGYGSHEDPAGLAAEAVTQARRIAEAGGRHISFVASVCGTEGDYQGYQKQISALENAGVLMMPSNAQAARLAVMLVGGFVA